MLKILLRSTVFLIALWSTSASAQSNIPKGTLESCATGGAAFKYSLDSFSVLAQSSVGTNTQPSHEFRYKGQITVQEDLFEIFNNPHGRDDSVVFVRAKTRKGTVIDLSGVARISLDVANKWNCQRGSQNDFSQATLGTAKSQITHPRVIYQGESSERDYAIRAKAASDAASKKASMFQNFIQQKDGTWYDAQALVQLSFAGNQFFMKLYESSDVNNPKTLNEFKGRVDFNERGYYVRLHSPKRQMLVYEFQSFDSDNLTMVLKGQQRSFKRVSASK